MVIAWSYNIISNFKIMSVRTALGRGFDKTKTSVCKFDIIAIAVLYYVLVKYSKKLLEVNSKFLH